MDSDAGDQASCSPAARTAPVAFGPRVTIAARASRSRSASPSPHPSAAAIQPRKPTPVVATTTSTLAPSTARVASSSRWSS